MVILFIATIFTILGIILLLFLLQKRKSLGVLLKKRIYTDTKEVPGELLYSQTIPLCGKPDTIIIDNGIRHPVEIKTGKTPNSPYLNHQMQLMAYCYLVAENYGKRPIGGYLRYPEKEFKIAYTKEAESSIITIVSEIMERKQADKELFCHHPEHNN